MIQNCFALKKLLHLPALFLLASLSNYGRDAADRPNIILFFLDDSGYGDYAHNGNPTIHTPNISKLAQDGTNFTQFYVTSPACSASRYSLLTGRYPGRSGLGKWVIGPGAQKLSSPQGNHHRRRFEDPRIQNRNVW